MHIIAANYERIKDQTNTLNRYVPSINQTTMKQMSKDCKFCNINKAYDTTLKKFDCCRNCEAANFLLPEEG